MTYNEFYKELESLGDRYGMTCYNNRIRLHKTHYAFCPITAVCYEKTGIIYNTVNAVAAGKELGLSKRQCCDIIRAADKLMWRSKIRSAMLDALMKEPE